MVDNKYIKDRYAAIRRSSWVGIVGNGLLAIMKITFGIIAGSAAVIGDGIDSATDIIGSIITFYVSSVASLPPDKEHPWGHDRIESIASKVIAIFILFAGIQLLINTFQGLMNGEVKEMPGKVAVVVTAISIVCKAIIASYKFKVSKKTDSKMVRNDAINMKNDIFLSSAVLIGLGVMYWTGLPIIDTIVGILLGVWITWTGIKLSLEANGSLLDGIDNGEATYKKLFNIISNTPNVYNPHKVKIRKLNNLYDITLDVEVDPNFSVKEGHEIAKNLENNIKKELVTVYDVLIHVEPRGNIEDEEFGLAPKDFKN